MAADDDERGPAPDPWDEIVAEGLGDEGGEIAFRFDEAASETPPSDDEAATPGESGETAFAVGGDATDAGVPGEPATPAADALVQDWLADDDGDSAKPPLAVFAPEDTAAGSSSIDIGTGGSGVGLYGAAEQEEIGTEEFTDALDTAGDGEGEAPSGWPVADETAAVGFDAADTAAAGFPAVAAGAAAGGAAKTVRLPSRPAKKKSGGIGQLIGVVLGGVMAIPITLAILIYGLGKDPFGVTKQVPAEVAFLLPEKFRPGYKKPVPADRDGGGGSALDALPTVTGPAGEPAAPADESAPPADESGMPADEPAPIEPPGVTDVDVGLPAPTDLAGVDMPGLDDLGAKPAAVAPAEPPPLDTAALDAAVGDAAALGEALGAVDGVADDGAYMKLRTRWYRALAHVAEELVAVENAAVTSGRPLADAPDSVGVLHDGIGRRARLATELASLAPDWLAYANRGSDGVVAPLTFESARRVGPYWAAKASLTDADGKVHDVTVISRREPAAIAGDRVVVTGVALDGAVIWAADVRGAAAGEPPAGF